MRSPKRLWPRTQDLDARQRTESQAARRGLVSGPAGGRGVSGAPAGRAAPSTRAYEVAFFYSCLFFGLYPIFELYSFEAEKKPRVFHQIKLLIVLYEYPRQLYHLYLNY